MSQTTEPKTITFSFMWSEKLGAAINTRSIEPCPMEFHNGSEDMRALIAAVNQGIDSHLEAIRFTESTGDHGRRRFTLKPQSVSVLVRRLMESGEEHAEQLAGDICGTLGIELI